MEIDAGTLRDLDILSTATNGRTVLELVDRTRTRAGQEQLRRCLKTPETTAAAIVDRQRAHQALASDALAYRAIIDRADLDKVEKYLSSNWQLPKARRGLPRLVASHWRGGWHGGYLADADAGRAHVLGLIRTSSQMRERLADADANVLCDSASVIAETLDSGEVRELNRLGHRSGSARLAFDRLAREAARPVLARLIDAIAAVEAMWSLGVATAENGWTYPCPSSRLCVRRIYHPFLDGAVPNDLDLSPEVRICFVTGPNMGGKSTFLKAVAIAILMAHTGCGVPAEAFEFAPVGAIFSSVKVSEDLKSGESFYLVEVRRIKRLAEALRKHGSAMAILDEPLRGTNVHDAAEATLAVVTRLAAHPGVLVFVASHISEIVPAIAGDVRIRFLHFAADVAAELPRFDYQLREGSSTQRLGMTLLRQEGVLALLERGVTLSSS